MKKGIYINDSIHGLIPLSEYEKRIISSMGFNRLHDVYQNSTVYLTFPSNRTKRFEHSIGTMKLCSDMFFASILNADEDTLQNFYGIFQKEYDKIITSIAADTKFCDMKLGGSSPQNMPEITFDKFRHSLVPNNVPSNYKMLQLLLIETLRAAALLHDIGHPPFSHIVEYALKSVYKECNTITGANADKVEVFKNTMSPYFNDGKKLHEQMGDEISESILSEVIESADEDDNLAYDENLFEVLIREGVKKIFKEEPPFSYLHRIIDSTLDGDRLDYVTRDSVNSGMRSGRIDYNRIINEMMLIINNEEIFFCVPLKAVSSIEDFIKRRYNVYKDIVNHHRVIKTDYLLEKCVRDLVIDYLKTPEGKTESSKLLIPFDISGLWFPLGDRTVVEKANALSQWNDSWLMTVLKQIYYVDYYKKTGSDSKSRNSKKKTSAEAVLERRMAELLRNKRYYYSLIKRSENFKLIDDVVKSVIASNVDRLTKCIDTLNKLAEEKNLSQSKNEIVIDMRGTLEFIASLISRAREKSAGFILSYMYRSYDKAVVVDDMISFQDCIKNVVTDEAQKAFVNIDLTDIIIVPKQISIGLDKPIYFYDYDKNIYTLDEISGISSILQLDADYLPVFYIYLLVEDKNNDAIVNEKRENLLRNIGNALGCFFVNAIESALNNKIKKLEEI